MYVTIFMAWCLVKPKDNFALPVHMLLKGKKKMFCTHVSKCSQNSLWLGLLASLPICLKTLYHMYTLYYITSN